MLEITNLSVSFRNEGRIIEAVKRVSFSIAKGEILAVVGESGSGKSVTALSILQLLPYPAAFHPEGSIRIDGNEVIGGSKAFLHELRGKRIGMIFQEPMTALNPLHTIGKQIAEAITIHQPLFKAALAARITELLDWVELSHFSTRLNAYPHQLSGGERQRVMIAMALANTPDLLIADEPTTALDVTTQQEILALIRSLRDRLGMAVMLITHDLTLVRKMAGRVVIMSKGELVEQGAVATIFAHPTHPYTQHLLASEPKGSPLPFSADAPVIIECSELSVKFPLTFGVMGKPKTFLTAVDEVSLTLREGETLGIVGESGSGKSTLAFALLRLVKSTGNIVFMGSHIDGLSTQAMRPLRAKMQVVFQDPFASLNPRMTIADIITEGLRVHEPQLGKSEVEARLSAILADVGLESGMQHRYPHEFSGGQRQRVSIARAMILRPCLVVLDEPTSALDLSVQSQILTLLKDLQKKYRLSYICISHDLRVIRTIAHHIAVMKKGKVIEYSATGTIFEKPAQDYTRTLITAAFGEIMG